MNYIYINCKISERIMVLKRKRLYINKIKCIGFFFELTVHYWADQSYLQIRNILYQTLLPFSSGTLTPSSTVTPYIISLYKSNIQNYVVNISNYTITKQRVNIKRENEEKQCVTYMYVRMYIFIAICVHICFYINIRI